MQMAHKIGFTLDEAEVLRRIVGKKKVEEVKVWKEKIAEKIKENKLNPEIGDVLWRILENSANYSFNKCLLPETIVESKDGFKCLSEVKRGDFVLAYDVSGNKDHFVEIENVHENEVEVYEVEMEDGTKICCSLDHKFLCEDKEMHTLKEIFSKSLEIMCK